MQNIEGTVALLEAVRGADCVSKLMFAGSGNEIGRALYLPIDEEHPLTSHNPDGFSKATAEMALNVWHLAFGVPSVVLSTGVAIGPGMRREVFIFRWLWNALHGRPIVVEGGGQTRDVAYIDEVVRAWMLAIEAPAEKVVGQKFFVGSGREHSIEDLARICRDTIGTDVPIEYTGYRPGEEGHREAFSTDKARRVLGYDVSTVLGIKTRISARNWHWLIIGTLVFPLPRFRLLMEYVQVAIKWCTTMYSHQMRQFRW